MQQQRDIDVIEDVADGFVRLRKPSEIKYLVKHLYEIRRLLEGTGYRRKYTNEPMVSDKDIARIALWAYKMSMEPHLKKNKRS